MPHDLKFPKFWEKAPWNKASTGVLRFLKFKNRQNWLCRRNHNFLKPKCCQKVSSGPQHCNPYPKTQCRFWKNNKRTSEHSPRLLGHTEPWHLAEWGNDRLNRPGWQTFNRWTRFPVGFLKKNLGCVCPKTGYSAFFWSTLARFRVASNNMYLLILWLIYHFQNQITNKMSGY